MSNVDLNAALQNSTVVENKESKVKRNREKALPFPETPEGKKMYKSAVSVDPATQSMPPVKLFVDDLDFHKTQINYANALIAFANAKIEELGKLTREERVASKKKQVMKQRASAALKSKAVRDEFQNNPLATIEILKQIGVSADQLLSIKEQIDALLAQSVVK